ncbi:MAG: GNAT family N-acetyltransferase [Acidobacteriota bacterium]|nr:GNAT family N-acetyltransferase [Acidobacteriota bacterium]
MNEFNINYQVSPAVTNDELNRLFANAWEKHQAWDFLPVLSRSLLYVCARHETGLIGFVNVAWDGAQHAFILDTTVDRGFRRRGIGIQLVKHAAEASKKRGVEWLHVDFEPYLEEFYRKCGFRHTNAGLINLRDKETFLKSEMIIDE